MFPEPGPGDSKAGQPVCADGGRDAPGQAKRARWSSVREREEDRFRAWRAAVVDRLPELTKQAIAAHPKPNATLSGVTFTKDNRVHIGPKVTRIRIQT